MPFIETGFPGLLVFEPRVFKDDRGYFFESYNFNTFTQNGITEPFVQDNQSNSTFGVIRGLHYQLAPYSQSKLVRALEGSILDVVVDLRKGSPTFHKTYSVELSAENKKQLFVPKGFAHGFQTLEDESQDLYFHSSIYAPLNEAALNIKDPLLDIKWPLNIINLSKSDESHPFLTEDFKGITINEM